MASDEALKEPLTDEAFPAKDIVFECGFCGKSLVINALGAGLAITCPDCGTEQQVPPAGGRKAANHAAGPNAAAAAAGAQEVEQELTEISDVLADAHEQINELTLENEELQFRRRFLEKRHAIDSQGLQALRREMAAVRQALDRMEVILKTMEEPSAGDTQLMA